MRSGWAPEELWREGLKLDQAFQEYSDPRLWEEYEELEGWVLFEVPPPDLPPDPSPQQPPKPLPFEPYVLLHKFCSARDAIRTDIIRRLVAGELLAAGYTTPRRRQRTAVFVPASVWEAGRVSWEASQLWTPAEIFEEVRILPSPDAISAAVVAALPASPPRRAPGRPSRAKEILQAYEQLRDVGRINFSSLNSNLAFIRSTVLRLRGGDPKSPHGLSNETIRVTIQDQFNRDRHSMAPEKPPGNPPRKK